MKERSVVFILFFLFVSWIALPCFKANAQETLRYSCSAQIFKAFGTERLDAFTKETGIKIDLYISSSAAAVYRLMNDFSDIAGAAEELRFRYKEFGYLEIPFCKDPLAVIINTQCPIDGITEAQLQGIFGGHIHNWKEVGGPDKPIVVIIPGENTAAYKNFYRMAMQGTEITYDFMSYQSTMVIKAVEQFPWAVSFIAHAAIGDPEKIKVIKIDGLSPKNELYPYFQTFYYVTKGKPVGAVKKFVDFTMSEKGIAMIINKGMIPVSDQLQVDDSD